MSEKSIAKIRPLNAVIEFVRLQRSKIRSRLAQIGDFSTGSLVAIITTTIFFSEAMVMGFLYIIPPMKYPIESLVDASLTTVLVFPALYLFLVRPIDSHLKKIRQTEEALKETNELLEMIFSVTHISYAYLDNNFNFIRVNQAYAATDGRTPEFYPGKNHFDIYPNEENQKIFQEVLDAQEPYYVFEKAFDYSNHPELSVTYWDWSLLPVKDDSGDANGILLSLIDRTQRIKTRKELENSQQNYEELLNSVNGIIWEADAENPGIRFISQEAERLLGYPQAFWTSDPHFWFDHIHPNDQDWVRNTSQEAVQEGRNYDIEYRMIAADGRVVWIRSIVKLIRQEDKPATLRGIIIDISDRKKALEDLQTALDMLELANTELRNEITVRMRAEQALEKEREMLDRRNQELIAVSESERKQRQFSEGLVEASIALSSSLDLDDVLDRILLQIQNVISFKTSDIMMVEDGAFYIAHQRGYDGMPEALKTLYLLRKHQIGTFPLLERLEEHQQPVIVTATQKCEGWQDAPGFEWVRSFAAAPLISNHRIQGIINLVSDRPGFFVEEDADRLRAFATHAALAIQNARIYAQAIHAQQITETLRSASVALSQTLDLDVVLNTLLDYVGELVPYDSANIMLLQDETRLSVRAARGYEQWTDPKYTFDISFNADLNPLISWLIKEQKSILIEDTELDPGWEVRQGAEHVRNWLGVPVIAAGRTIGIYSLDKVVSNFFTQEHVQLTESLVGQAGVAIQNAWLFEQVRSGRERLQSLSRQLVEIQETERRYIARELHDEAGQSLTSLMVGLRLLEREINHPEALLSAIGELKNMVDTILENLHRLAVDLRPASLDHLGLIAALQQYIESISDKHATTIQFETLDITARLPQEMETALYRIVQEGITNAIRHSRATRIDVLLEKRDDKIITIVEDNGIGFDPLTVMQGNRLGLFGIRERAEMLGGSLIIESSPGNGCTILVEVPYAY